MEVSVSFLKDGSYKNYIKEINKTEADYIHFDVMDGKFVSNKNLPLKELSHPLTLSHSLSLSPFPVFRCQYFLLLKRSTIKSGPPTTDMMMLIVFDSNTGEVNACSIPRDTMINLSADAKKINGAIFSGVDNVKSWVRKTLGVYPNFYILLDWQVIDRLLRKTVVWEYPQTVHEPTSTIHEGARSWLNDKQEEYKSQEKPRKTGSLSFGEAISNVFSHYADFSGRARRSEYWWFFLLNMILSCIPYLGFVWALVAIIPSWAVAVRRLHDIGRSGWYLLLGFIPLVGAILLIVWYCKEGEPNRNQYGEDPKRG